MRRNDPGLTGGIAAPSRGGRGLSVGPLAIVLTGAFFGYLATLHGAQIDERSLVAFGVWSAAAILLGFLITWFFRYVFVLIVLLVAALWWTDSPSFRSLSSEARSIRGDLCQQLTFEFDGVPYKEWIC